MTRRVYLHVGLPKTGTSTIQQSLWASRERLGEHGFSVPGDDKLTQRYAVWDLLGRRIQGADQRQVPGSWNRLVDRIREDPADTVLASEELLVHARPRHVRRIVRDLAPVELNVVVTLRNLAAVVGSMWQQEILGGATWTWHDFVLAVADPEQGPPAAGVGFWLRYDLDRVLSVWGTSVPADRMHIVVVPGRDAPRGRLLELYAEAIGVDRDALVVPERLVNPAMGPVGSEILRRLNLRLGDSLTERQRQKLVGSTLRPALRESGGTADLWVPDDVRDALAQRSQLVASRLERASEHVYGDLEDLLSIEARVDGVDPDQITDADLLDAAMNALTAVSALKGRRARARASHESPDTGGWTRMRSKARAMAFRARTDALGRADSNRALAWASRLYLRWRPGR